MSNPHTAPEDSMPRRGYRFRIKHLLYATGAASLVLALVPWLPAPVVWLFVWFANTALPAALVAGAIVTRGQPRAILVAAMVPLVLQGLSGSSLGSIEREIKGVLPLAGQLRGTGWIELLAVLTNYFQALTAAFIGWWVTELLKPKGSESP